MMTNWAELEHAYGSAEDVPALLNKVRKAKGSKLQDLLGELGSRVLHQGSIYSASPAALRELLPMAREVKNPKDKAMFLWFFAGFAESARESIPGNSSCEDDAEPSCCCGSPQDAEGIRAALTEAHEQFLEELQNPDPEIRTLAVDLLSAFPNPNSEIAARIESCYFDQQATSALRHHSLLGLIRLRQSIGHWDAFASRSLETEQDPHNRLLLLGETITDRGTDAADELLYDFANCFAAKPETREFDVDFREERFFKALERVQPERAIQAMLHALKATSNSTTARLLSQHLLRRVFSDTRTNWQSEAHGWLNEDGTEPKGADIGSLFRLLIKTAGQMILWKLFPFIRSWQVKRMVEAGKNRKGMSRIQLHPLGDRPPIPSPLAPQQKIVLLALANQPVLWTFKTNLWELFALPDSAERLRDYASSK